MGRTKMQDEDWAGVLDLRKRKQIQDRLAQRARSECTHEFSKSYPAQPLSLQGND